MPMHLIWGDRSEIQLTLMLKNVLNTEHLFNIENEMDLHGHPRKSPGTL